MCIFLKKPCATIRNMLECGKEFHLLIRLLPKESILVCVTVFEGDKDSTASIPCR